MDHLVTPPTAMFVVRILIAAVCRVTRFLAEGAGSILVPTGTLAWKRCRGFFGFIIHYQYQLCQVGCEVINLGLNLSRPSVRAVQDLLRGEHIGTTRTVALIRA